VIYFSVPAASARKLNPIKGSLLLPAIGSVFIGSRDRQRNHGSAVEEVFVDDQGRNRCLRERYRARVQSHAVRVLRMLQCALLAPR
jgi:hypothetical protein